MYRVDEEMCTGCATCVDACREQAISLVDGYAQINTERCTACGSCAEVCPQGAIQWVERTVPVSPQSAVAAPAASRQPTVVSKPSGSRMPQSAPSRPVALWQSQVRPLLGGVLLWAGRELLRDALAAVERWSSGGERQIVERPYAGLSTMRGRHGGRRYRGGRSLGRS